MFELIKKTLLTGVGLAVMTKDKIEELAKELVQKGELSEKEGKEFIEELQKKSEQAGKDLETRIDRLVQKAMERLNVATKDDVAQLSARIGRLEQEKKGENE